jgi:hypothetical protein
VIPFNQPVEGYEALQLVTHNKRVNMEYSKTPITKTPYRLYKNGKRGFIVELYTSKLPKTAPFIFYGSLEKCKSFIASR